jgi:hypothetical protein
MFSRFSASGSLFVRTSIADKPPPPEKPTAAVKATHVEKLFGTA